MSLTVIKLGGSLLNSDALANWLDSIRQYATTSQVVVVPGGGRFADLVREIHASHSFEETTAHRMALLSMCQYGYLLSDMCPEFKLTESIQAPISESVTGSTEAAPFIWLPYALIDRDTDIPASWNYTSDSIALWLAIQFNADKLFLVKSTADNTEFDLNSLIKSEKIDKGFQSFKDNYSGKIYYFNQADFPTILNSPAPDKSPLVVV